MPFKSDKQRKGFFGNLEMEKVDSSKLPEVSLYRVGTPRVTETTNRFDCGRDTGGIGTGIYGYSSLSSAMEDSSFVSKKQNIFKLSGIIKKPLELSSERESIELNNLGKAMRCKDIDKIKMMIDFNYIPSLKKRMYEVMSTISDKKTIDEYYEKWMLEYINMSIELADECARKHNGERIINDIDYSAMIGSKHCSQPINKLFELLEIDSVIPYGHLADSNWMGSVILKERVDKELKRKTVGYEDIPDIGVDISKIKSYKHILEK